MINRVHGYPADVGALALPACTSGFPELLTFMLCIADLPDTGSAFLMETPYFT